MARVQYGQEKYDKAEEILVDCLERGEERGSADAVNIWVNGARGLIWKNHYRNPNVAESLLWTALCGSICALGPRYAQKTTALSQYERIRQEIDASQVADQAESQCLQSLDHRITEDPFRFLSRPRANSLPPESQFDEETEWRLMNHGFA